MEIFENGNEQNLDSYKMFITNQMNSKVSIRK
jgi:hypothetical protein